MRLPDPRSLVRSPLVWVVLLVGAVHLVGIGWGLPASDGWDNDGVAPRDFLPGLLASFSPGRFYTYPPVHLAILAVVTLPIPSVALLRAPSLAIADIVGEVTRVPYMTAMASVARLVALAMSLGVVLFIARLAEELRAHELGLRPETARDDRRVRTAGYAAAAFVGVNASLAYYAHTSNLDVPYLFWATWSLLLLARAIARSEPRLLRRAFAFAALALGTKDQAYAVFLLSVPITLGVWLVGAARAGTDTRRIWREAAIAVGLATAILLVVEGALVNPTGFRARLAFLTGSASQDYVEYSNDWSGRLQILVDGARTFHLHYPALLTPAIGIGLVRALLGARRRTCQLALALLPLLVAVSFTVTFNWSARRTDPRFFLPQAVVLAVYGGLGIDWLVTAPRRLLRIAGQAAASIAFAKAAFVCISVDANLLGDPRYEAEAWLRAHALPEDTIETYGLNVYLPRMTSIARVVRVGPERVDRRNPLPGVTEVEAPFEEAPKRGARFIVVPTAWVWRYLPGHEALAPGRVRAPTQSRTVGDVAAVRFFEELARGEGSYAMVHDAKYDDHVFPPVDVHGTTARWIWIFERRTPAPGQDRDRRP
jgi:hypothetical protein